MMMRNLPVLKKLNAAMALLILVAVLAGCRAPRNATDPGSEPRATGVSTFREIGRYLQNRCYDLCDVGQLGVGVVPVGFGQPRYYTESGILPWGFALGAHMQVTDFFKLGYMNFSGYSTEWDGRGFYAGYERRSRMALGPMEMLSIGQKYHGGFENYFKKNDSLWAARMASEEMSWRNTPAKELNYGFWADTFHMGVPPFRRGWQHWSEASAEAGFLFFTARAGLDASEALDFLTSWVFLDIKRDDMTREEYKEKRERGPSLGFSEEPKPASD